MLPYVEHLLADTKRRFDLGLTSLPEGEEHMIAPVKRIYQERNMDKFEIIEREVCLHYDVIFCYDLCCVTNVSSSPLEVLLPLKCYIMSICRRIVCPLQTV